MSSDAGLRRDLLEFMADPGAHSFGDLALRVFGWQVERNAAYRSLVSARGIDPRAVSCWEEIPAVSTVAFKSLSLCCGSARITFRTSGTTRGAGRRGEHHLCDPTLYQASLRRQFLRYVLPDRDRIRFLVLAQPPEQCPDSSLGFMLADIVERHGAAGSGFHLGPAGLEMAGLLEALSRAEAGDEPVALLGTAFAFVHLLDHLAAGEMAFRLPAGSRIMDTGGFKGRSREISRAALLAGYQARLGIPPTRVVNEYGMTEMASQFYDASLLGGDPEIKRGPHWVRTRVIDPESGADAPAGQAGLLCHLDLANLDSVACVETEDLGFLRGGGFVLLGRAAGAEPRGCSLAVEEMIEEDDGSHPGSR